MSTLQAPPPTDTRSRAATVAANLRAAADFLTVLDTDGALSVNVSHETISIQIPTHAGRAPARRGVLAAGARLLGHPPITEQVYGLPSTADWGSLHAAGDWAGTRIDIWTPLTRAEARAAGLAVCETCAHADHDEDTGCLAAMTSPEGTEYACPCGGIHDEPNEPDRADHDARAEAAWDDHVDAERGDTR